jgi:hypothetical protein
MDVFFFLFCMLSECILLCVYLKRSNSVSLGHGCFRVCIVPVCFSHDVVEQDSCRRRIEDSCKTNKNGENRKEDVHTRKDVLQSERVEELKNANVILQEYIKLIEEHMALKKELSTLKNLFMHQA